MAPEFIVNENGCNQMCEEMRKELQQIRGLITDFEDQDGTLRAALGGDYEAINQTVRTIKNELNSAENELNTVISATKEYMAVVHQARVVLN